MGLPAARLNDPFSCPKVVAGVADVGGVINSGGSPNVRIENIPAARMGDLGICTGTGEPNAIVGSSKKVRINGMPAARQNDSMAHGGFILLGALTVKIG